MGLVKYAIGRTYMHKTVARAMLYVLMVFNIITGFLWKFCEMVHVVVNRRILSCPCQESNPIHPVHRAILAVYINGIFGNCIHVFYYAY
jgi:hypothetical protein